MAHHNISVFFEAMWGHIVGMYHSELDPCLETTYSVAGAAGKAPGAAKRPPRRNMQMFGELHAERRLLGSLLATPAVLRGNRGDFLW